MLESKAKYYDEVVVGKKMTGKFYSTKKFLELINIA